MDISWQIDRVLTGKAGAEEIKEVEKWIAQNELNRNEFEALRLLYESSQGSAESVSGPYDGLSKIKSAIEVKQQAARSRVRKRKYAVTIISFALIMTLGYLKNPFIPMGNRVHRGLTFNNQLLEVTLATLEKEYNISIQVERSEVRTCRFSGTFSRTSTTEEIMETLASAMDLKYQMLAPRTYKLLGWGCIR